MLLKVVQFNPLHAKKERLAEISAELREYHIVCLSGTKRPAYEEVDKLSLPDHVAYLAGWRSQRQSHAGVAVLVRKNIFKYLRVVDVYTPDSKNINVKGRVMSIRVKSDSFDLTILKGNHWLLFFEALCCLARPSA